MATLVAPRNHFPQEDAEALWKAVKGVRRAYHNRYKHSLEEDVAAHTTGHVRQASLSP
ncbi:hypothetical protein JHK87_036714 [Glycine soja]|nr:hypothetical protein JHK87_036714 [Glycine soja]